MRYPPPCKAHIISSQQNRFLLADRTSGFQVASVFSIQPKPARGSASLVRHMIIHMVSFCRAFVKLAGPEEQGKRTLTAGESRT